MAWPVNHDTNRTCWCGPAALSALTGKPTSTIVQKIKANRLSNKRVAGTHAGELIDVAASFDLKLIRLKLKSRFPGVKSLTLARFAEHRQWDIVHRPILVSSNDHWFVIHSDMLFDSEHKNGIELNKVKWRCKRIVSAYVAFDSKNPWKSGYAT